MAKQQKRYLCEECGYSSPQWLGKCPNCGKWETFIEEVITPKFKSVTKVKPKLLSEIEILKTVRISTGINEFDRVLGGGIVEGSIVLVGGEPGIGKSTLLLQSTDMFARNGISVLYVSGEESPVQIKLRAKRLQVAENKIYMLAQTDIEEIVKEIELLSPDIVIIDSIQTVYHTEIDALPGSVTQVRGCALKLMEIAKSNGIPVFIIGHVTKEGTIAGPKTLEHMVDAVLYLEGDKNHYYRILRAAKNRFGSTQEIGVFEMKEEGLSEVKDPSFIFLGERHENPPGTVVTCAMEGSRPFLVEIQALLAPCGYRMPQRVSAGIDYKRLTMLLAVVERRVGVKVSTQDVFINVVGGLHIEETASDLAVILAIVSGARNTPVAEQTAALGEVGLTGEVRPVGLIEKRVKEAERLGLTRCIVPSKYSKISSGIKIIGVKSVGEAIHETLHYHSKL
ncbi:MAG: DNA repair protein RadA [bacterium]|nr:DNA repair protein RadA [bacterium]